MGSIPEILQHHNTPEVAAALIDAGYYPVPIPAGTKGPQVSQWEEKAFKDSAFRPVGNIGLHHVNIASVDKDCPEVLVTARRFLPSTFSTGKESTPDAHSWYVPVGAPKFEQFKDTNGEMIIELRFGKGFQTMIPPSVHPDTGQRYVVGKAVEPVEIDAAELRRAVGMAATAALIARHLPVGGRHDIAMHIMGFMGHNGETEEDALAICEAAWEAVDAPTEAFGDLETLARTTWEKIDAGEPTTGGKRLGEDLHEKLPRLIGKFLGWKKARGEGGEREGNQAQRLVGYAMDAAGELFLDQNGTEHALIDGAPVPLDSGCYGWLRRLFWLQEGTPATTDLLGTVAGQLRAFAEVSPVQHTLHLRAAQHGGAVYLYLGPGRVVRVDASGWELDSNPPVMFRRVANLKDLPDPERGGSLELLDAFITAQEDRDHRLAKTWLALALLADINRPILLAHGPQGSTKSSVQRVLKNIIDPGRPETLKLREKDFEQNINKAFIPFFDNISTVSDYMADELSKAVTGAGNAVRKLYANDEDVIREYKRAVLLNGLVIPTEKADLIDRILPVALRRVPKEERKTETRMDALFKERHPKLLGAVLDALSGALAHHEEVEGLPRLAAWAEYAIALYKHLGWGGHDGFMDDWAVVEEGQHETTLEASVLAQAVVAVVDEHGDITRSPKAMLELLRNAARSEGLETDGRDNDFPGSVTWLSKRLVPQIPTLEANRIKVEDGRENSKARKRFIRFYPITGPRRTADGQQTDSSASDESGLGIAKRTARTGRTADFPENSKDTEARIDNGTSLQGGKNAVRPVRKRRRRAKSAKVSQVATDSRNENAVRNAVRKPGDAVRKDADPKAEAPEEGRESLADYVEERVHYGREEYLCNHERKDEDEDGWECLDCLAASYDDEFFEDEKHFWHMPINKKITLREWVRNNIVPAEAEYSAYFLKHEAENGLGFYVRAGELTGALYEAGYLPTEQSCRPWFKYTSLRTYRLEARAFIWDLLMWRYLGLTHHRLRMVFLRREHRRLVARMTEETYAELADVLGEDHA